MAKITYVEFDGTHHTVEVKSGLSVMEGAVKHAVPGIDAECGGACACATCQILVDEPWRSLLPAASEMEISMLDFAGQKPPAARLSCQIKVTPALDGLTVGIPETQG
jgi:2Fe-2S ferredoxin